MEEVFEPKEISNMYFLDETFAKLYASEARFQKGIYQSCDLGNIDRLSRVVRTCHILCTTAGKRNRCSQSIRCIVPHVVALLSKDFLKLVLIALVLAIPVAWWLMNEWLKDFAYRVNIEWWIFLVAAIIAIIIAFVTISTQAIKAAISNPVKSLRTE